MSDKTTYIIDLQDQFSPKLHKASNNFTDFENKLGRSMGGGGKLAAMAGFMGGIAGGIVAEFGSRIMQVATSIFTLGAEMEQTKVSMEVLIGSADRANQLFNEMTEYANVTPFSNTDINKAAETMLGFGESVENVMPNLAMLGDLAKGNSQKLGQMTLAFSQMTATGRLQGQDLLQMINAGFNPLLIISEKTGKSMGDLKKQMEAGALSADLVKNAFISATSAGGDYYQMSERQSKTMAGAWSTFMGTVEHGLATFGMKLAPYVVKMLDSILEGFSLLSRVDFGPFLDTFGQIYDMIGELWAGFSKLFEGFGIGLDGMTALQLAFDILAGWVRAATTPLRVFLEILTLVGKTAVSLYDVFAGLGEIVQGVFTLDLDKIKSGLDNTMAAIKEGWTRMSDEVSGFITREKEGWGKVFAGGTPDGAEGQAAAQRHGEKDWATLMAEAMGGGKDGKKGKKSGVDGDVRSGGVKNITINIAKLVGEVNFGGLTNMTAAQATDIVKRALLTAVNDANLAV